MKYLVSIHPTEPLPELITAYREGVQEFITEISLNIPHCTLMGGRFQKDKEPQMIEALEAIKVEPFRLQTGNMALFGNALVARIRDTEPIRRLHYQVLDGMKLFIDWDETYDLPEGYEDRKRTYQEFGSPFYAEHYEPHITVCRIDLEKLSNGRIPYFDFFRDINFDVEEFHLSRKEEDIWKEVKKFRLDYINL